MLGTVLSALRRSRGTVAQLHIMIVILKVQRSVIPS
jgi:hypothetical protein